MLECKHFTGSAHTALDLIQDQHNAILITKSTNPFHKFLCSWMDTALSLQGLHNNSTGIRCDQSLNAV